MRGVVRSVLLAAVAGGMILAGQPAGSSSAASAAEDRLDAEIGPLRMAAVHPDGHQVKGNIEDPSISANGRYVTYTSPKTQVVGLPSNGFDQVFRYDRRTGTTILVSMTTDGLPGTGGSSDAAMSADGRVVAFQSWAGDLLPGSPTVTRPVIAARDLETGETELVSRRPGGGVPSDASLRPLVSDDGSLVEFEAWSADITGVEGAVLYDRSAGTSSSITVEAGDDEVVLEEVWLSGDGDWITFASDHPGIVAGDDNAASDVFRLERATGDVTLVSRSADGSVADAYSGLYDASFHPYSSPKPLASTDGSLVVFFSHATDLAGAEDSSLGEWSQAFAFDAASGTSSLVTEFPDGTPADDLHNSVSVSPDGRYVAIESQAFLAGGSGPLGPKVYVRDLERGQTRAASSDAYANGPGVAGRNPHVVFSSRQALVPEDTDGKIDPYLRRVW